MPNTEKAEADALLLLLYGYTRIKNQHDVTALRLAQAAKQTGIQADRLDRLVGHWRVRSLIVDIQRILRHLLCHNLQSVFCFEIRSRLRRINYVCVFSHAIKYSIAAKICAAGAERSYNYVPPALSPLSAYQPLGDETGGFKRQRLRPTFSNPPSRRNATIIVD